MFIKRLTAHTGHVSKNGSPFTVTLPNSTPLSVHTTLPVVTLIRLGLSEETVACSSKLSPQVAVLGDTERVVFVAHANSMPAAMLVPACRLNNSTAWTRSLFFNSVGDLHQEDLIHHT